MMPAKYVVLITSRGRPGILVGEQLAHGNANERNQRKCRKHGAEHERCGKFSGVDDRAQRCERDDADDGEEHIA